jgi:hypothetical protein
MPPIIATEAWFSTCLPTQKLPNFRSIIDLSVVFDGIGELSSVASWARIDY